METKSKFKLAVLMLVSVVSLFGCGSDKGTSSNTTAIATYYLSNGLCYSSLTGQNVATSYCGASTGYYLANGYCYSSATGQVVTTSYCSTTTTTSTTGYYLVNGYCYSSTTGQVVASTYCGVTSTTTTGTSQVCVGYYYYMSNYGMQMGYCNGTNCRGYTLYQYGTNQQVYCQ